MKTPTLRVGQVAKRTGLTVRTLHHWDRIGLLSPEERTPSGHRIYRAEDLQRLQKTLSLRSLGLGLKEIGSLLRDDSPSPGGESPSLEEVLSSHRDRVRERRESLSRLEGRLDWMLEQLKAKQHLTEENLLQTMELMAMIDKHYTPGQLDTLKKREEALGPDAIQAAQEEWPRLIASLRAAMDRGDDPSAPEVQRLASRWKELVEAFSGGDPGIESSLAKMYREEPGAAAKQGLDPGLFQYVGAALNAGEAGE